MIDTACPECHKPVQVPQSRAGKMEICDHCGKEMTIPSNAAGAKTTDKVISGLIAWPVWSAIFFATLLFLEYVLPSANGPEFLVELGIIGYIAGGTVFWTLLFRYLRKRRWRREHGTDAEVPPGFYRRL